MNVEYELQVREPRTADTLGIERRIRFSSEDEAWAAFAAAVRAEFECNVERVAVKA
jgi:hypothetical protein